MQSGLHQATFNNSRAHKSTSYIADLFVDIYNRSLISVDNEGLLCVWDFFSRDLKNFKQIDGIPLFLRDHKYSQLFVTALDNENALELFTLNTLTKARRFIGHKGRLTDASFTADCRTLASCSIDKTVKLWDIMNGNVITNLKLSKVATSIDFSPNSEYLAMAFVNSKELHLWHSLIGLVPKGDDKIIETKFFTEVKSSELRGGHQRELFYKKKGINDPFAYSNQKLEDDIFIEDKELNLIKDRKRDGNLKTFCSIPVNKWLPLIYIDEIKEKNKPKENIESNLKIPFFLDFNNQTSLVSELNEQNKFKRNEKSKIIKEDREKALEELGTGLDKLIIRMDDKGVSEGVYDETFEYLKQLNPSQVDFELRRECSLGNIANVNTFIKNHLS